MRLVLRAGQLVLITAPVVALIWYLKLISPTGRLMGPRGQMAAAGRGDDVAVPLIWGLGTALSLGLVTLGLVLCGVALAVDRRLRSRRRTVVVGLAAGSALALGALLKCM